MKPNKIINGFCYLDGDDMMFISLYNERKYDYEASLFSTFIKDHKITEDHIILANEDNKVIIPLFKYLHRKGVNVKNIEFENLIKIVYDICIEITSKKD